MYYPNVLGKMQGINDYIITGASIDKHMYTYGHFTMLSISGVQGNLLTLLVPIDKVTNEVRQLFKSVFTYVTECLQYTAEKREPITVDLDEYTVAFKAYADSIKGAFVESNPSVNLGEGRLSTTNYQSNLKPYYHSGQVIEQHIDSPLIRENVNVLLVNRRTRTTVVGNNVSVHITIPKRNRVIALDFVRLDNVSTSTRVIVPLMEHYAKEIVDNSICSPLVLNLHEVATALADIIANETGIQLKGTDIGIKAI